MNLKYNEQHINSASSQKYTTLCGKSFSASIINIETTIHRPRCIPT